MIFPQTGDVDEDARLSNENYSRDGANFVWSINLRHSFVSALVYKQVQWPKHIITVNEIFKLLVGQFTMCVPKPRKVSVWLFDGDRIFK